MTHKSGSTRRQAENPTVQICKCRQVPCSKVDCRVIPYKQMKTIPLSFNFPTSKRECLFSFFTSSKRVTNTHWSSSSDESILIFFTNLRKEGFIPKIGSYIVCFMSLMQENSFVVSCLESLKWLRILQTVLFRK